MTYRFTDSDGCQLAVSAWKRLDGTSMVSLLTDNPGVYVDLDRLEELITGIRDEARKAA